MKKSTGHSRILRKLGNMICYEMGSPSVGVYTMAKDFSVWMEINMVANMVTRFFARGVLWRSSFLGNLKPSNKKLGLQRTPFHPYQPLSQMTLSWAEILDWPVHFVTGVGPKVMSAPSIEDAFEHMYTRGFHNEIKSTKTHYERSIHMGTRKFSMLLLESRWIPKWKWNARMFNL